MREVVFRDWKFEVDSELTRKSYEMILKGSANDCICEYCKNFREQRERIFPEELKKFFKELSIDLNKEEEVSEYDKLENGLHLYIGSFNFAGKILSGKKFEIGNSGGIQFTEISENFSIAFGERKDNYFLELWFETNLPWVIDELIEESEKTTFLNRIKKLWLF